MRRHGTRDFELKKKFGMADLKRINQGRREKKRRRKRRRKREREEEGGRKRRRRDLEDVKLFFFIYNSITPLPVLVSVTRFLNGNLSVLELPL